MRPRALSVVVSLLAAACVAPGTPFTSLAPIPAGQARLYVFRPSDAIETSPEVLFQLDGVPLARTRSGGYSTAVLAPGVHRLVVGPDSVAGSPTLEKTLQLEAGKPLFCGYGSSGVPGAMRWSLDCSGEDAIPPKLISCNLEPLAPEWGAR